MLGLGPGIDYGAVGESMAMAAVMKDARRAQAHAEGLYQDAVQIIQDQRDHIEGLNARIAQMQKLIDAGEESITKAFAQSIKKDIDAVNRTHAERERMWGTIERVKAEAKEHAEKSYQAIKALRSDVALLCATNKGLGQMAVVLARALGEAAPGHALVSPNGNVDKNGDPLNGIDETFDSAYGAFAGKAEVEVHVHDAIEEAGKIADRVAQRASRSLPDSSQRVLLQDTTIF